MAANASKPKQASRWGSLLSGAVSGLESRLDSILAEEGAVAAQKAAKEVPTPAKRAPSPALGNNISRTPSTRRTKATQLDSSRVPQQPPVAHNLPERTASPQSNTEAELPDAASKAPSATAPEAQEHAPRPELPPVFNAARLPEIGNDQAQEERGTAPKPTELYSAEAPQSDAQTISDISTKINGTAEISPAPQKTHDELTAELQAERRAHEQVELRRQEETHDYLERIDALQAKLQYLSMEAAAAARQAVADAGKDLLQKRIAERDERIALLMEEGTELSRSEVTQASTLRTLRTKGIEDANSTAELRRKLVKVEGALAEKSAEASRLETEKSEAVARASRLARYERDVPVLKQQAIDKDESIARLQRDLREAKELADEDEKTRIADSLEQHQKITQSLRDDLANAKIEQCIRDDRARAEANKYREQLQREVDRNKGAELGLRNEITTLESRMEVMREKSEEASTGTKGDAQAKLMRQIEILQSQYAVASENWQGIEASLQSRVTALERERDESSKHETEARRKAREAGSNSRRLQDQLDDTTQRCRVFEHDVAEQRANADRLQLRASEFEKALQEAKTTFDREKSSWNTTLSTRIEEEKLKWQRQTTPLNTHAEPSLAAFSASPQTSNQRRISQLDLTNLNTHRRKREASNAKNNFELNLAGLRGANGNSPSQNTYTHSRRTTSAAQPYPPQRPDPHRSMSDMLSPTSAEDSGLSTPFLTDAPMVLEPHANAGAPSIHAIDTDDALDNNSRSSPRGQRTINDMFSASTAGAGPSVQLVERMSASVRRLETEKAASREEMARLGGQRDEARREVVSLMTEVEEKRALDEQLKRLESELEAVSGRYAGALEMAGEKSERVEELEADVADLKGILREMVEESTGGKASS